VTLKSGLEVTEDHSIWYHSKVGCGFVFAFHSNYDSILYDFRDKARYWSKIVIFSYSLAFNALVRGLHRNTAIPSGVDKLEWWATRRWTNFDDTYNRLDRILACVRQTDRRTDRQTSFHDIVRAMHTRRGVK